MPPSGAGFPARAPILYVVATPIGNLEDVSPRAARALAEAHLVVAEDTRHTRKLLAHLGLHTPLASLHRDSPPQRIDELLAELRRGPVALVTDAGTPTICDPGREFVAAAASASIPVSPIPGPSAAVAALSVSGLSAERVLFLGFLPRHEGARARELERLRHEPATLVLYEAPHRLRATLRALRQTLGDRPMAVARELTKLHEEVVRGPISQVEERFAAVEPRGELTLVVAGAPPATSEPEDDAVSRHVANLLRAGMSASEAAGQTARALGVGRRRAYRLALALAGSLAPSQ